MTALRPGEAEAVEAVADLVAARGISGPALSTAIADGYVAAAYPVIAAAVREQDAQKVMAKADDIVALVPWRQGYRAGLYAAVRILVAEESQ